jgi:beta-N-acetylhexosaminidase
MPHYSRDVKIGQLIMVGFRGRSLSEDKHIRKIIRDHQLGSVVFFDDVSPFGPPVRGNVESLEQLKALTREIQKTADIPLFIALDHEGGSVNRLKEKYGFPPACPASEFGDRDDETFTREESGKRARLLKELEVNVNLAPVVDVNVNPQNPALGLRKRCISADPEIVTKHARIMIEVFHENGIFPP